MKGDPQIIQHLNTILTNELTSVNQYFLHGRTLQHWGLEKIGGTVYRESIEEMKHADALITRILFLDGLPNMQNMHKIRIGEAVPEMLQADLELERKNRADLGVAVATCETKGDYNSREILQRILADTEDHIDWCEKQLELIERVGLQNYLQTQMGMEEA
jgi:bacterioferritin